MKLPFLVIGLASFMKSPRLLTIHLQKFFFKSQMHRQSQGLVGEWEDKPVRLHILSTDCTSVSAYGMASQGKSDFAFSYG